MSTDPNLRVTTLPNGLRIVTRLMPGLHSASVGVWVNAGGRDERLEQNGIAHFLEHMAFKGTKTRSALAIAEASRNEPGVTRFDLLQQVDDPTRFILYEEYVDEAATQAHKTTPHYLTWRETVAALMATPRVTYSFGDKL